MMMAALGIEDEYEESKRVGGVGEEEKEAEMWAYLMASGDIPQEDMDMEDMEMDDPLLKESRNPYLSSCAFRWL
jgi:hypothetical protein